MATDALVAVVVVKVGTGKKLPVVIVRPQKEVVAFYRFEKQAKARKERESFAREASFESAVRRAGPRSN